MPSTPPADAVTPYPLAWPLAEPRTPAHLRRAARFSGSTSVRASDGSTQWRERRELSVAEAMKRLHGELRRLDARNSVVSTNLELRRDGEPYSQRREPDDVGVAVYFGLLDSAGRVLPVCLPCDRWTRVADNLAAVAGHIAATRAQERYGVGTRAQAFAGFLALPPARAASASWRETLGFPAHADPTVDDVMAQFKVLARKYHPDVGGSHEKMAELTEALSKAKDELGVRQ